MRAFPRASQRFRTRWRSYGATPFFCVRDYKDVTPTEPFFNGSLGFPFERQQGSPDIEVSCHKKGSQNSRTPRAVACGGG